MKTGNRYLPCDPKTCLVCKITFYRPRLSTGEWQSRTIFEKRKYCSYECAKKRLYPTQPEPEKYCKHCGERMHRKMYNGRREEMANFLRRQFCDLACSSAHGHKEFVTLSGLLKRATKFKGSACQECGSANLIGIHHKDRNPANNSPENLLTLCASCHTALHWREGKKPWKERAACKVCSDPARRNGLCQKHWQRFKKYGDPNLTRRRGLSGPIRKQPFLDIPGSMSYVSSETASCQQPQNEPFECSRVA